MHLPATQEIGTTLWHLKNNLEYCFWADIKNNFNYYLVLLF